LRWRSQATAIKVILLYHW